MRILIIGNEGTGQSVLGNRMSGDLGIPVTHLDFFAWTKNFRKMPEPVFRQRLAQSMTGGDMIIEGWALQSAMKERLLWAQVIIYLCFSVECCIKSVAIRNQEYNQRSYLYDPFEGDRLSQAGLYSDLIYRIHNEYEPEVQVWLKELEDRKKIYTYYSREDLEQGYGMMVKRLRKMSGRLL